MNQSIKNHMANLTMIRLLNSDQFWSVVELLFEWSGKKPNTIHLEKNED